MPHVDYPAGLPRRLAAAVYDLFLLIALLFAAAAVVLAARGGEAVPPGTLWFECYLLAVGYLFFGWFWTRAGQTLGMRAWRLRVRQANGDNLDWLQALRRYLAACLSWVSLIGVLWCLFDAQRRTWQDMLSNSEVVVTEKTR